MTKVQVGIFIGAILAFFLYAHGFGAFILAALFMLIGGFVGRISGDKVDVRGAIDALLGKTSD